MNCPTHPDVELVTIETKRYADHDYRRKQCPRCKVIYPTKETFSSLWTALEQKIDDLHKAVVTHKE